MNWKELIDAFEAFNVNGMSNLAYVLMSNAWFVIIILAAVAAIVINLKDAMEYSINEEQQVL